MSIEIEVEVKSWGNSAGVLLPKKLLEKSNIKKGDKIKMRIEKKDVLDEIRGKLKGVKSKTGLDIDAMLEDADKGWSRYE